jgi:hypothetical protein
MRADSDPNLGYEIVADSHIVTGCVRRVRRKEGRGTREKKGKNVISSFP